MDAATHQLTAASVTGKEALERNWLHDLLTQTTAAVERVCAEGAYDFEQCYRAIKERGAVALIPPREGAVHRGKGPFEQRDENLRAIESVGRKEWKRQSTYHRRSLVETAFCCLKMIFSDRLRSRRADTQTTETLTRCLALSPDDESGDAGELRRLTAAEPRGRELLAFPICATTPCLIGSVYYFV